jgi:hypothetical protein
MDRLLLIDPRISLPLPLFRLLLHPSTDTLLLLPVTLHRRLSLQLSSLVSNPFLTHIHHPLQRVTTRGAVKMSSDRQPKYRQEIQQVSANPIPNFGW